jgi:DNA-binding winged helix-turn-helix (wHTH) protein
VLFRFASFTLDPEARKLRRSGREVAIQPRVFDLLLYLVQNRDRLVGHDELLREVWRGVTTTEGSLSRAISLARSALADPDGERRGVLETVRGRGYRIAVPVDLVDALGPGEGAALALVGREKELRLLHEGLDRALSGRGAAVFVAGEAGIGKTRIAEEFTRAARARGAGTLWASAYEGEGGPAFWVWTQILTAYARSRTSEQLAGASREVLEEVATLIPELQESLPAARRRARVVRDLGRFRAFEAVARLLDVASRERALVLALDDLHWADEASLDLLRFVASGARGQRLLLVGTYREREAPDVLRDACGYCNRVLSFTQ